MNQMSESIAWSYLSIFGAVLGYSLYVVMSWGVWRKTAPATARSIFDFFADDPPRQIAGVITVVFIYCSLSIASQVDVIKTVIGFTPKVDFFSAFVTAYASQSIGVKMGNMLKKISGSDQ